MSIAFDIKSFGFSGIAPYGWAPFPGQWNGSIFGHEFTMVATVVLKSSTDWFGKTPTVATLPTLVWAEREFWWEGDGRGNWVYKGTNDKGDLYASTPGSPTWGGFKQDPANNILRHTWITIPGSDIRTTMQSKLLSLQHAGVLQSANTAFSVLESKSNYIAAKQLSNTPGQRQQGELKLWWTIAEYFASKSLPLVVAALDRPGMAKSGGSGASGGGFVSKTTSTSRRRVLQFELSMLGRAEKFTATQILETQNAEASISKFLIPGQSDDWCLNIPEKYLAYWRAQLDLTDVYKQTTDLETESVVDQWVVQNTQPWVSAKPRVWMPATPSNW